MKPDGSGERILVDGFHNEGPTFSPNGLYLMFFRDAGGSGGPKLYMTDIFGHAEFLLAHFQLRQRSLLGPATAMRAERGL